jgi:hypothetical protein
MKILADLNGDGQIELIATTTVRSPDKTVWVFSPNGQIYQPVGGHSPAWPRYNLLTGEGNDADVNGEGQEGYGMRAYIINSCIYIISLYGYRRHRVFLSEN